MDQPGKAANPARGQLNKENEYLRAMLWNGASSRALVLLGGRLCACVLHTRVQRCCFEKITTPSVVKPS